MGLLANTYIFYADVYFIQNSIIKAAVLILVVFSTKKAHRISFPKIIGLSIGGTVFEIIGLILISNYNSVLFVVNCVEIPLMMLCLFGSRSREIVKTSAIGYFFVILINGILEAFGNMFGQNAHYLGLLVLSCIITILGTLHILRQKKMQKGIFEVELTHNGTKQRLRAYYDSGNCLKDPYTGKGVHIASERVLLQFPSVKEQRVCIPYQSLGNETGLLDVYYIEKMQIHGETKTIELQKIPIGVTKEDLFQGKQYEMILNEEIW